MSPIYRGEHIKCSFPVFGDAFSVVPLVRVVRAVLKQIKSIWWMPWHREAMKDVALCDKLRGGESTL